MAFTIHVGFVAHANHCSSVTHSSVWPNRRLCKERKRPIFLSPAAERPAFSRWREPAGAQGPVGGRVTVGCNGLFK
jgi:hypothetical protein